MKCDFSFLNGSTSSHSIADFSNSTSNPLDALRKINEASAFVNRKRPSVNRYNILLAYICYFD